VAAAENFADNILCDFLIQTKQRMFNKSVFCQNSLAHDVFMQLSAGKMLIRTLELNF
jgi:hypothetical protein